MCGIKFILIFTVLKVINETKTNDMTTAQRIEEFKIADKKVSKIEGTLDYTYDTYVPEMILTDEYNNALSHSQELYKSLINDNINPFN